MLKNTITAALPALILGYSCGAFAAAGTVNFAGNILDSACEVAINSQNQTVVLGDYYKTELSRAGERTAATGFDIVLKDCPSVVTSAKVRFDGTPDNTNASLLAINNSAGTAATGVAINLMTADKSDLPLHGSNGYSYPLSSTQDNTLGFFAQYIATADGVTAGTANSVANFSIVYN